MKHIRTKINVNNEGAHIYAHNTDRNLLKRTLVSFSLPTAALVRVTEPMSLFQITGPENLIPTGIPTVKD
jgi:hypothetical protein